ncbi:MAG: arginine--tRNA ligase [Deltaproteobacteria bacterium]|jgi:arginyl-tRNA synthetase|nr:arginine--tRNA ligase [Deltaproteobacteria bacterium]
MRAVKHLSSLLRAIVADLGLSWPAGTSLEPPREKRFGDLALNLALVLAREAGARPLALAEDLAARLRGSSPDIASVQVAGPGFLNVTFAPAFWQACIPLVEAAGERYGASNAGRGRKAQVEFVSANPTGPLHVGHGRGAAVGDALVRILRFAGYEVCAEYYLNDAGKQMRTLGLSIWKRVRELAAGDLAPFPEDYYQGGYIRDIAREMLAARPDLADLPEREGVEACLAQGMQVIFEGIRRDLQDFRVFHDSWFSEKSLVDSGAVARTLRLLEESGLAYERDGALWFRSSEHGDDRDRVLRKSDGSLTYFASDIAYHADKYARGFELAVDVWGADHHGYIPRMRAAVAALGQAPEALDVLLIQLVNLLREGRQVAMSTRAGEFETLADVLREVGTDAARFIFLSRKSDSKLDFDLELVRRRTLDNPVYYVQYAHARIRAVRRRALERGFNLEAAGSPALLTRTEELDLLRLFDRFPLVLEEAARDRAPHYVSQYLTDLAGCLHHYYAACQILAAGEAELTAARLRLTNAAGIILGNGLKLLGVSAPESM